MKNENRRKTRDEAQKREKAERCETNRQLWLKLEDTNASIRGEGSVGGLKIVQSIFFFLKKINNNNWKKRYKDKRHDGAQKMVFF
jgi:hypothetical protein